MRSPLTLCLWQATIRGLLDLEPSHTPGAPLRPYQFRLRFSVLLRDDALYEAARAQPGFETHVLTMALHTYLRVGTLTARRCRPAGRAVHRRPRQAASLSRRTATSASQPKRTASIRRRRTGDAAAHRALNRTMTVSQQGFVDTVVWNPHIERSLRLRILM